MIHDVIQTKWRVPHEKITGWLNKRIGEHDFKMNSQRERLIKVLQKRYGYSKEKAASELETTYLQARLG